MRHRNHKDEEKEIVISISCFPTFLNGTTFVPTTKEPPDFIGTRRDGHDIGLELTRWLDPDQTKNANRRQKLREDLFRAIDWERHPRPQNFSSAIIFPKWVGTIRKPHCQRFCSEFHAVAQQIDADWKALRAGHWSSLRPDQKFDYEVRQGDLKSRPTLSRYVDSIWFAEASGSHHVSNNNTWVGVIPDGGLYDPRRSIQALKSVIEKKVKHYGERHMKLRLGEQNLQRLYLLVYADPGLFASNTPFQTGAQMMVSPTEGLADAATAATEGITKLSEVFSGVFLFYPVRNSRWLARIWPTFERISCVDK